LEALAAVGIIEGAQLFRLFSLDKKRLKRMVLEKKIVRHELIRNKQVIPIFTLGINGAVIGGLEDSYESNYWVEYKVEDVLKRLLFFQLFKHFTESKVFPTSEPFSGAIGFKEKLIYVYVVRGDVSDLLMYFKWKGRYFNERFIIVTESLQHLQSAIPSIKDRKLRLIIDTELYKRNTDLQNQFYLISEEDKFIKD